MVEDIFYPDVASIRMPEIHCSCPIVRFVLLEPTGGAGREPRHIEIGVHGQIEPADISQREITKCIVGSLRVLLNKQDTAM